MLVQDFFKVVGSDFYCGVPDSQLKPLCNYLMDKYGIDSKHHIIGANEGNCVAIGAGYHLATGKIPVVYMQNSGEGNIINPVASILNKNIYAIPMIFIIGWRGEPDIKDEPQHIFQGKITLSLLNDIDISYYIIDEKTSLEELSSKMDEFKSLIACGNSCAFIIKKNALKYNITPLYRIQAA